MITGAASGIGQAAAHLFAQAGARVVASDINGTALDHAAGHDMEQIVADMGDKASIDALCARALVSGPIDIWCNVAGVGGPRPALEVDEAEMRRIFSVNLDGVYWASLAAGRAMAGRGGAIVNISSNAADEPMAGLSLYAASKAGVNMLTRSLAKEFGPLGIRVNAVAPSFIRTGMTTSGDAEGDAAILARHAARSPLGRVGEPEDVANAMLFLASDAASFVTGQVWRVNGGVTML